MVGNNITNDAWITRRGDERRPCFLSGPCSLTSDTVHRTHMMRPGIWKSTSSWSNTHVRPRIRPTPAPRWANVCDVGPSRRRRWDNPQKCCPAVCYRAGQMDWGTVQWRGRLRIDRLLTTWTDRSDIAAYQMVRQGTSQIETGEPDRPGVTDSLITRIPT